MPKCVETLSFSVAFIVPNEDEREHCMSLNGKQYKEAVMQQSLVIHLYLEKTCWWLCLLRKIWLCDDEGQTECGVSDLLHNTDKQHNKQSSSQVWRGSIIKWTPIILCSLTYLNIRRYISMNSVAKMRIWNTTSTPNNNDKMKWKFLGWARRNGHDTASNAFQLIHDSLNIQTYLRQNKIHTNTFLQ